jgi:RimJ/RimL family protein N-acetyltransferase
MVVILETKRLQLRVPQASDLPDLIALRTDIDVMSCIGGFGEDFGSGKIQPIEQIKLQLDLTQAYYDRYGLGFFCAFEKTSHQFVGQAGLFHVGFDTSQPKIELAYRLHKAYWGKGYATELVRALIDWGLNVKKLPSIMAAAHPGNQRSIRVLEKSGMTYDGIIDFRGHRLPGYSINRRP